MTLKTLLLFAKVKTAVKLDWKEKANKALFVPLLSKGRVLHLTVDVNKCFF